MNNENLIECLRNQIYKLENDIKVKVENEKHLVYENETLFSNYEQSIQNISKEKELNQKLQHRNKKLESDLEVMYYLTESNEESNKKIEQMKLDYENLLREYQTLKNQKPIEPTELPEKKLQQLQYEYSQKYQEFLEIKSSLQNENEFFRKENEKIRKETEKEIDIFKSKIDSYKETLEEMKRLKEEAEFENAQLQTESNQPDFSRQGNSMYCEVNDRRILAEKTLIKYQEENEGLRQSNIELRDYLERAFTAFSELKEEEIKETKRDLMEKNESLSTKNKFLTNAYEEYKHRFKSELNDATIRYLYNVGEGEKRDIQARLDNLQVLFDKMQKRKKELYWEMEKMHRENNKLMLKMETLQLEVDKRDMKIQMIENLITPKQKDEIEQQLEEQFNKRPISDENKENQLVPQTNDRFIAPPQIFGGYYVQAQYSDKLVFDHSGKIIGNKLTRKINEMKKLEEAKGENEKLKILNYASHGNGLSDCETKKSNNEFQYSLKISPIKAMENENLKVESEVLKPLSKNYEETDILNKTNKDESNLDKMSSQSNSNLTNIYQKEKLENQVEYIEAKPLRTTHKSSDLSAMPESSKLETQPDVKDSANVTQNVEDKRRSDLLKRIKPEMINIETYEAPDCFTL